jgi:hypothetical protein
MKSLWVVSIIVLNMVSCGHINGLTPVETDQPAVPGVQEEASEPGITEPTDSDDTETPLPPQEITPTNTSLPAPAQPEPDAPAAIIARVEGMSSFILVGGSLNGAWVGSEEMLAALSVDQTYQLYSADQFLGVGKGDFLDYEPICKETFVDLAFADAGQHVLGLSGDWPALPRIPQELAVDFEVYLEAVAGWLVDQAPSQPVVMIEKIWRVDMEGDGADEVFINATRFSEPSGHSVEPRDYSVVLMRTVIGNEVVTVELVGDYYPESVELQFPLTYSLEFIGDLNGDGRLEVVVGVTRWEGVGVLVFEIDHENVEQVLSVMCFE